MTTCKNCGKSFAALNPKRIFCGGDCKKEALLKEKVVKVRFVESKLADRFRDAARYDVVANDRKTGLIEFFERGLTYEQTKNINPADYEPHYGRYKNFRLVCVPPTRSRVVTNRVASVKRGTCLDCKKIFTGEHCDSDIRHHVAAYGHKVVLKSKSKTVYKPE